MRRPTTLHHNCKTVLGHCMKFSSTETLEKVLPASVGSPPQVSAKVLYGLTGALNSARYGLISRSHRDTEYFGTLVRDIGGMQRAPHPADGIASRPS